jgi:hypothetical protein
MQYCTRNPAIKKPGLSDASSIIDINDNMDVIDSIICKNNFNGAIDPGIGDDIIDGYAVGSHWWNVTDHRLFIAESVTTGSAVWRQVYPTIDAPNHNLATATNDFLVASGAGVYVKKTLAETQTILGCRWSINEVPSGLVNGSNVTFTLAYAPAGGQIMLYLNGQYMTVGVGEDYTISGSTITMVEVPIVGDKIRVNYPY